MRMRSLGNNFLYGFPIVLHGYTDPISNAVVIAETDASRLIRGADFRPLPEKCLEVLLHEATHHTCFFTPVGRSLAALAVSAAGETSPRVASDKTRRMRQHDIVKHYCFAELFRPLAEGLAVFAQFDAYPGDSPVLSETARKAFFIFFPEKRIRPNASMTSDAEVEEFRSFLCENRWKKRSVDTKSYLLSLPLSHEKGAYLLGYLFVKNLHLRLIPRCLRLRDSDLFLSFLTSYWFSDALLAEMLVRDTEEAEADIQRVFSYFRHRMAVLTENVSRFVTEFEHRMPRADYYETPNFQWPSYCNRERVDELRLLIQQELRVVGRYDPLNWDLLGNRPAFRFAASQALLEKESNGRITVCDRSSGRRLITGSAMFEDFKSSTQAGSMEAVLLPDGQIIVCIFDARELVATLTMPDHIWNETSLLGLSDTMLPYQRIYDFLGEIEEQRILCSDEFRARLEQCVRNAHNTAVDIFAAPGPATAAGSCGRLALDRLQHRGLSAVLDMDKDQLEFASRVSLLAGHGLKFEDVAGRLNLPEPEVRDSIRRLEVKCLSELNFRPFLYRAGHLLGSAL